MENQAKLIAKIKALFATAQRHQNNDGTSNEQEAASAAALAQKLLLKYNLDIKTVQDATVSTGGAAIDSKREKAQLKRTAMYRWQVNFWKALAEMNMCFYWIGETQQTCHVKSCRCNSPSWPRLHTVKRHVILGAEANVAVVMAVGDYLTETIERLVVQQYGSSLHSKAATSWREGCSERLIERLTAQMAKMKRDGFNDGSTQCTALAVQDLHEKEYAANYDAKYGAGSYARSKQREAEWVVKSAEMRKRHEEEKARALAGETPAERGKRERDEARAAAKQAARDAAWWNRYHARQEREEARRDVAAYARGHKKANDINLDAQVPSGKKNGGLL